MTCKRSSEYRNDLIASGKGNFTPVEPVPGNDEEGTLVVIPKAKK